MEDDQLGLIERGWGPIAYPGFEVPEARETRAQAAYTRLLRSLDTDQRAAVELPFNAVAAISANAGAGKTTATVARLLRYIVEGGDPASVVALSFTRKAANEVKARFADYVGDRADRPSRGSRPIHGTGHVFGLRILGRMFGLRYTPLSAAEGRHLLRQLPTFQTLQPRLEPVQLALASLAGRAELPLIVWPEFDPAGRLVKVHDVQAAATGRGADLNHRDGFIAQYQLASWYSVDLIASRISGSEPPSTRVLRARSIRYHAAMAGMEAEDFVRLLVEHTAAKYSAKVLEFSDMLLVPFLLMLQHEHFRDRVRQQCRMFLVDEAQDMSALDFSLVAMAAGFPDWVRQWPYDRSLMLVGDSKQSLYWWRQGLPLVMDSLDRYSGHPEVRFGSFRFNYRSVEGIVHVCNSFARTFDRRHIFDSIPTRDDRPVPIEIRHFPTTKQEDKALVVRLQQLRAQGTHWADCVILARMNHDLEQVQSELVANSIPYKMSSNRKLAETEAFAFLNAMLGIALNPRNTIAASTLARARRGVGDAGVAKMQLGLREQLARDDQLTVAAAVARQSDKAAKELLALLDVVLPELAPCLQGEPIGEMLGRLSRTLAEQFCWPDRKNDAELEMTLDWGRLDRMLALVVDVVTALEEDPEFLALPPGQQLGEVCAALSLAQEPDEGSQSDAVTLTTIHGFKGGEAENVFVIHLTRKMKVSVADADGERCAFNVAVTRAKNLLYLSSAEKILDGNGVEKRWRKGYPNTNLQDFTARHGIWERMRI